MEHFLKYTIFHIKLLIPKKSVSMEERRQKKKKKFPTTLAKPIKVFHIGSVRGSA